MEVKIKEIISKGLSLEEINISSGTIIAIYGKERNLFLRLLHLEEIEKGVLYIDRVRISLKKREFYQKKIGIIKASFYAPPFLSTPEEYLHFYLQKHSISCKKPQKKIEDSLRILGISKEFLKKPLSLISETEQKYLQLSALLLLNPEIFLLEDFFCKLDLLQEKKLLRIFRKLKEKYKKTILFSTNDVEKIYSNAEEVIFLEEGRLLFQGKVKEAFQETSFLKQHQIPLPEAVAFTNLVKEKKQISLGYYKDIRDLIKDIYRNV